jgi:hypothetical protein
MKKLYIGMLTILVLTLVGAGIVYKFVVQARLQELAEEQAQKEQLLQKIQEMENLFSATAPPAIIRAWREKAEPWRVASVNRTAYFDMPIDIFEAKVPETEIPRFYYNEEIKRRVDELNVFLRQNRTTVQDPYFGVPNENFYGRGSIPSAEEIEQHLRQHALGSEIARMLSRAGVREIRTLNIWPRQNALDGQVGRVDVMIIGISATLPNSAFIRLIEQLRTEPRYYAVDAMRTINTNLLQRQEDPTIEVEFLLVLTDFEERKIETAAASATPQSTGSTFTTVFQTNPGGVVLNRSGRNQEDEEQTSWWQDFRRRFLPF